MVFVWSAVIIFIILSLLSISFTKFGNTRAQEQGFITNDVGALIDRGGAHFYSGHYEQEIEYYDIGLSIDPINADALNNKGNDLFNSGQYEQAIEYYDRALAIDPNHLFALTGKGGLWRIWDNMNRQ